jgi:hypothetical protein
MTSSSDDLEKALQQNLKLRRELGTEIATASNSSAKQMAEAPATPRNQPPKLTTSEARQGTGTACHVLGVDRLSHPSSDRWPCTGPRLRLDPTSVERHALN